ncbi:hypothetical protein DIBBI_gp60 [Xanthomonas phage vB_XveM_DIBBI]|uniref:Uncharacterized protein n=1 Tax=Xanthomonas phage vB_XveM_DIBBI TaxID=1129194 RepID=I3PGZ3_9CAUD|nr:hypothetical protein DIBBI_gp60 [Xanthomonas phage vB_XveM_DIBBI]AEX65728.1 hypothetical protein DIBBI_060 [Xanthomonas phage vB_XveM_DIBBI]
MNNVNAEFLRTYIRALAAIKDAGLTTAAVDAADFERILAIAQQCMWEAEMEKSRHCHHGHGVGSHPHGQETCIKCAGIMTTTWDFQTNGLLPNLTPDTLKQHYVGRMVYGEAYKG